MQNHSFDLQLGPLQELMSDAEVTEIMVNGPDRVFVERHGKKTDSGVRFTTDHQLRYIVERLVATSPGKRLDESNPYVDLSLPDGSRVNVVIPPLVLGGPHVTIRKFSRPVTKLEDFVRTGTMDRRMALFLHACVRARLNVLFSGGTGVGKTTLMEILAQYIEPDERIVVIEDTLELHFPQHNVVRMLTRSPNLEGKGQVTAGDLFRNSLRMTPSRIILGEIRGREALDYLQAMNSGHDGSLAITHASSPDEATLRLENLVALSGVPIAPYVVRRQIGNGLDVIVQIHRFDDGTRRVTHITEIAGVAPGGEVITNDIFRFEVDGVDAGGRLLGHYAPTGHVPGFYEHFRIAGVPLSKRMFEPEPAAQDAQQPVT